MRCQNCNSAVEENWNFCAICGANIALDPERMAKAIESRVMSALEGTGMSGFAIRVVPQTPHNAQNSIDGNKRYSKRLPQKSFLETPNKALAVVEPKTDITRLPGKMVLEAELPGVSSGNSIKIMVLGESIEMRAAAPEKMYMKILRIPKNMRIAHSAFAEGKLRVELCEDIRYRR